MAFQNRNKFCYFKENGISDIDYKDVKLLRRFVNDQGKIMPRRVFFKITKFISVLKGHYSDSFKSAFCLSSEKLSSPLDSSLSDFISVVSVSFESDDSSFLGVSSDFSTSGFFSI